MSKKSYDYNLGRKVKENQQFAAEKQLKKQLRDDKAVYNAMKDPLTRYAMTQLMVLNKMKKTKSSPKWNAQDGKKWNLNRLVTNYGIGGTAAVTTWIVMYHLSQLLTPAPTMYIDVDHYVPVEPPHKNKTDDSNHAIWNHSLNKVDTVKLADKATDKEMKALLGNDYQKYLDDDLSNGELRGLNITYYDNVNHTNNGTLDVKAIYAGLKNDSSRTNNTVNGTVAKSIGDAIVKSKAEKVLYTSKLNGIKPDTIANEPDPAKQAKYAEELKREQYYNITIGDQSSPATIQDLLNAAPGLNAIVPGLENIDPDYHIAKVDLFNCQNSGANESSSASLAFCYGTDGGVKSLVLLDKNNTRGWVLYDDSPTEIMVKKTGEKFDCNSAYKLSNKDMPVSKTKAERIAYQMEKKYGKFDRMVAYSTKANNKDYMPATVVHGYKDGKLVATGVKYGQNKKALFAKTEIGGSM
jgi:hypothetical protein